MIPTTKISHTILEFGKVAILDLPENHAKAEFKAVMDIVILVWNAVVMDSWKKDNRFELEVLSRFSREPEEMQWFIKQLIKRKKTTFASDPRAVGNYWVKEKNGQFIFGCDARLDVENVPVSGSTH